MTYRKLNNYTLNRLQTITPNMYTSPTQCLFVPEIRITQESCQNRGKTSIERCAKVIKKVFHSVDKGFDPPQTRNDLQLGCAYYLWMENITKMDWDMLLLLYLFTS